MKRKEKLLRRTTARIMGPRFAFREVIQRAREREPRLLIRLIPTGGRSKYQPGSWKPKSKVDAGAGHMLDAGYVHDR